MSRAFWDVDQMRDALATWHMGRVILAYRTHPHHGRTLTQELVGSWLGITQAQLSRVETGRAPEEISKLIRYAQTLGIPADLLWFKLPSTAPEAAPSTVSEPACSSLDLARWIADQSRGVRTPAAPDFDEAHQVAAALRDARRYFDGPVVDFFKRQLARCKADDGKFGPAKALPLVVGILGAVQQHSRDVRPNARRSLLSIAAEGAEFAGWLYRDLNTHQTAAFWYDRAMEWAQEANNVALQGYVLMKKSQMAYDRRDALRVITLAQAAEDGPWQLPAKVRAEVLQQGALGLALTGEPIFVVERQLDEAHTLLAAMPDEENQLGAYFNEGTLLARSACCYTEAGKPERAVKLLSGVISGGTLSRRDAGFFGARRAAALALSGEPEEAAQSALESLVVARTTRSERTINVVLDVLRALEPWRHRPSTRALRDALATI